MNTSSIWLLVEIVGGDDRREQLGERVARRYGKRLALQVLGRFDPGLGERDHAEARGVEQRHHGLDRQTFGAGQHQAAGIGHAEVDVAGGDHLGCDRRAAPFLDGEIDVLLLIEAALLAQIERRVQAAEVPVQDQRDVVGRARGRRGAGCEQGRGDERQS